MVVNMDNLLNYLSNKERKKMFNEFEISNELKSKINNFIKEIDIYNNNDKIEIINYIKKQLHNISPFKNVPS